MSNRPVFQLLIFYIREKVIPYLFDKPRLKSILQDPNDGSKRLLLLNENITDKSLSQLPKSVSNWIFSQKDLSIVPYVIHLDYNYYTASEVCVFKCFNQRF